VAKRLPVYWVLNKYEKNNQFRGNYIIKPALIPALPKPAQARPTMNTVDVGAVAQIKEPASKMAIDVRKTFFIE
jgi:hypothetical protein